jgi:hypothetical protein
MKNLPKALAKRNRLKRKWKRITDPKLFPHKIKKICKDCGELKFCGWNSSFTQTGKPEYKARCAICFKKYLHRIRTSENSKRLRNIRRKRALLKRKKWAVIYLGGNCEKCGYKKCLSALTFHHNNTRDKEYEIGILLDWRKSKLVKELKKCTLLCFNCHMELHEKENN